MAKTLIIYDSTGYIISQQSGDPAPQEPQGIPFLWVEIPEGKRVTKIDTTVTPNVAVYGITPPTIEDRVSAVETALLSL